MHLPLGFQNSIKQAWDCTKLISSQALWNKKVKNHKRKSKMEKSMVPFTAQRNNLHLPPWKLVGQALQASRLWLVPADKWHQCWEERCDCIHSHKVMSLWFSPLPLCLQTKKCLLCSPTEGTVQCRAWQSPLGTHTAFRKDDRTLKGHCSVQRWWWGWHSSSLAAGLAPTPSVHPVSTRGFVRMVHYIPPFKHPQFLISQDHHTTKCFFIQLRDWASTPPNNGFTISL